MKLGQVIGKGVSSLKAPQLDSSKLLIVEEIDKKGSGTGIIHLAVDTVGAGNGEVVAILMGSSVSNLSGWSQIPCDAAIIAIMDQVIFEKKK